MSILHRRNLSRFDRVALTLLAIALLGLLAAQGCTSSSQDAASGLQGGELPPAPKVGRIAPDFTLVDLEGKPVTLSDYRGKTVFLNFWATWCPPCRAEMPEIEAIFQEYNGRDVVVIGIDLREPEDEVRQYVRQGGYSWTFVMDTTGQVSSNYRVTAIPTSFFLDGEGIIRAVNVGAMTKRAMESRLAKAMR
ncbi:MAG: TlpA disulfide reductase family protein [Dehalococcoidia bacterium]